jgi:hypothetical protein
MMALAGAVSLAIVLFWPSLLWADQFQVWSPGGVVLRYKPVAVKDLQGRRIDTLYTDRLGRFEFTRPGRYSIEVDNAEAQIDVRSDDYLKRVKLR